MPLNILFILTVFCWKVSVKSFAPASDTDALQHENPSPCKFSHSLKLDGRRRRDYTQSKIAGHEDFSLELRSNRSPCRFITSRLWDIKTPLVSSAIAKPYYFGDWTNSLSPFASVVLVVSLPSLTRVLKCTCMFRKLHLVNFRSFSASASVSSTSQCNDPGISDQCGRR